MSGPSVALPERFAVSRSEHDRVLLCALVGKVAFLSQKIAIDVHASKNAYWAAEVAAITMLFTEVGIDMSACLQWWTERFAASTSTPTVRCTT